MAVTSTPIFAQTPYAKTLTLAAQTACTTRAPTATASLAGANITAFVPVSTNGLRIDSIQVNAVGTGITTATQGAITVKLDVDYVHEDANLYVHFRTNAATCTVDRVELTWEE